MKKSHKKNRMIIVASVVLVLVVGCGVLLANGGFTIFGDKTATENTYTKTYAGYNLDKMAMNRTSYVGNASKVSHLVMQLPEPDSYYKQQYIHLQTEQKPYGLTVFYEPTATEASNSLSRPDHQQNLELANINYKNALVLFAMIDNVDEISFAFRNTSSTGQLDQSAYDIQLQYLRSDIAKQLDITMLSKNVEQLGKLLENWKPVAVGSESAGSHPEPAIEVAETSPDPDQLNEQIVNHANEISPDGKFLIEAFGENSNVSSGGNNPAEGIRLLDVASQKVLWSMTPGYYLQSFLWSPDSRYVTVSYMARAWGGTLVVDTQDQSEITLPSLQELRENWNGETTENGMRSDPYFKAVEWLDSNQLSVSFEWTGANDLYYSGKYLYDVTLRKLLNIEKNEIK
ncbi:DUF4825 domain-containing protein [Cohnella abietis]|uniref:DUF4825 domain-containing protein n=1 Tax=Cohnella abietis TaxID=2507935 RepID=A0A3T1D9Y0_9BACL|nr:DUF4825 domain-containing protein [Cohnella abietis]BBI34916.1 hypothetical protein KCTCHS21_43150 [Cohnella abietis]